MAADRKQGPDVSTPPENLVVMGYISGAFGIKGWVKLQPFTETPDSLLDYPAWWIEGEGGWQRCKVEEAEVHGPAIAARIEGCEDRDQAARYRGRQVAVPRDAFPEAGSNEYYWTDLIGLRVVNEAGEDLGTVSQVIETGANDVLVVDGPCDRPHESKRERLIPFIEHVVREVDLPGAVIRVDWGSDY